MRELLKKLIQTAPIDQKGEIATAQVLQNYLTPLGIETKIDCYSDKNANFISRISGTGKKGAFLPVISMSLCPQENWSFPAFEGSSRWKIWWRGNGHAGALPPSPRQWPKSTGNHPQR
jgi:acetylornithine deacetylase/succinyl-diaminopimelate desuccinylase-like protein